MGLLKDYNGKSAETTRDRGGEVVTGCRSRLVFDSFKAEVDALEVAVLALTGHIVPLNQRTKAINDDIMTGKISVVRNMDLVRFKANIVCNGDEMLEIATGFKPSKTVPTKTTHMNPIILIGASATGAVGNLLLEFKETIPGNLGYEIHYVMAGKDYVACVSRVNGRTKTMLAFNFPCGVKIEVYAITLGPNKLRSIASNRVPGQAI